LIALSEEGMSFDHGFSGCFDFFLKELLFFFRFYIEDLSTSIRFGFLLLGFGFGLIFGRDDFFLLSVWKMTLIF